VRDSLEVMSPCRGMMVPFMAWEAAVWRVERRRPIM